MPRFEPGTSRIRSRSAIHRGISQCLFLETFKYTCSYKHRKLFVLLEAICFRSPYNSRIVYRNVLAELTKINAGIPSRSASLFSYTCLDILLRTKQIQRSTRCNINGIFQIDEIRFNRTRLRTNFPLIEFLSGQARRYEI
jgi:hypothetical protein